MSSKRAPENQPPLTLVQLIVRAVEARASDLIVSTGQPMGLVNGLLSPVDDGALGPEDSKRLVYEIMTEQQIDQLERENDVVFSVALKGVCRARVAISMQRGAVAATLRLLPVKVPSLLELGFSAEACEAISALTMLDAGLVLVAGGLGSGKTSTLASMVSARSEQRAGSLLTVERPIEYALPNQQSVIAQREVGAHSDVASVEQALRAAPAHRFHTIMVGELVGPEALSAAIDLVDAGCLVLAGVRATSVAVARAALHHPDLATRFDAALAGIVLVSVSKNGQFSAQVQR